MKIPTAAEMERWPYAVRALLGCGAALMAAHGWLAAAGKEPKWEKLAAGFSQPVPNTEIHPDKTAAKIYGKLLEKYAECEREALDN